MPRLGLAAVAFVPLTVAAALTASAEKRVALLVGNKDYKPDPARPSVRPAPRSTWRNLE
jgi:hypothetical protein